MERVIQLKATLFLRTLIATHCLSLTFAQEAPNEKTQSSFHGLARFKSNLPTLIFENTQNRSLISESVYHEMPLTVVKPLQSGGTALETKSQKVIAGLKVRGTSTAAGPKHSYNLEIRNGDSDDLAIPLCGLADESDWVLRASYNLDLALIRDALIFKLSRKLGHYAPRTKFVEVFIDQDANGTRYPEDYLGVYVLTEKIKRGRNRVRIHKLKDDELSGDDLTGGYLFKDDRPDPGDEGIKIPEIGSYYLVDPKEKEIAPAQIRYLRNILRDFTMAVKSPSGIHPILKKHYSDYIDLDSWLTWHWMNVLAGNLDTYKGSAYFYKHHASRNGGRIEAGPLWDFDRSMNSLDPRDDSPFGWGSQSEGGLTFGDQRSPWWGWLLAHQDARQAHIDLWHKMRAGDLSWKALEATIDEMAYELQGGGFNSEQEGGSPVERNFARWPEVKPRGGNHAGEIQALKDWLKLRLQWIDAQFTTPPKIFHENSYIEPGKTVMVTGTPGAQISYTLDGSDPLNSTTAKKLQVGDSIPIQRSTILKARAQLGIGANSWSGITRRVFLIGNKEELANLEITERDLNPKNANNEDFPAYHYEYFALKNPSATQTVDLTGAEFTKGIKFQFDQSPIQSLPPGKSCYLVYDVEAFQRRYGVEKTRHIAGTFRPTRLNNSGEQIQLIDGVGNILLDEEIDLTGN